MASRKGNLWLFSSKTQTRSSSCCSPSGRWGPSLLSSTTIFPEILLRILCRDQGRASCWLTRLWQPTLGRMSRPIWQVSTLRLSRLLSSLNVAQRPEHGILPQGAAERVGRAHVPLAAQEHQVPVPAILWRRGSNLQEDHDVCLSAKVASGSGPEMSSATTQ
jgi:hypothetical protein